MEPYLRNESTVSGQRASAASLDARRRATDVLESTFPGLSRSALDEVVELTEWAHVARGETLIREGERARCLYLVVSGRLRVYGSPAHGDQAVHRDIGRGVVVGEVALLTGEPHAATVRATRDSELLVLSQERFEHFMETHPTAMRQIVRANLVRQQRSITMPDQERRVTNIAVVPAGAGASLSEFAARLSVALSAFGPTLHLDRAGFERGTAHARKRSGRICRCSAAAWLHEQESTYGFVVYESDPSPSPWSRLCVRRADHVVTVGVAGGDPSVTAIEGEIAAGVDAPKHLVLLHADDTAAPVGTHAWLAARQVATHHHVRASRQADYDRVARFVTGRAVAVVLGGGGARGMAHIGAIRAIEELGIPIDMIGGTSSGAVIAGTAASGFSWGRMFAIARQRLVASGSLLDFTIPLVSLVSGRRISMVLQQTFGNVRIEDLWLNYFCVSTNLSRARMVVHRDGPLWKAVRASVSLPGILPPVVDNGDLLVDGGVMNKLPVDVMRGLCNGGKLLAVSVSPTDDGPRGSEAFGEYMSGWSILRRRLNPFDARVRGPGIANILMCSTFVKSAQTQESLEQQADRCVRIPPVPIGLFDFRSLDAIVEAGYRATIDQLRGWEPAQAPPHYVVGPAEPSVGTALANLDVVVQASV